MLRALFPALALLGAANASAVALDADDIGGIVTEREGPGSRRLGHRRDRRVRHALREDRRHRRSGSLPRPRSAAAANYKVWVRGYGLADSAQGRGDSRASTVDLDGDRRAGRGNRRAGLSGRLLVRDDEAARGAEVAHLPGGRNEYLMWVKNMALRRLPSDGQPRDAHAAAEPRQVQLLARCMGAAHSIRSGRRADDAHRDGQLGGVPIKYLADWTDRIARGELPASQRRSARRASNATSSRPCATGPIRRRTCTTCPAPIVAIRPSTPTARSTARRSSAPTSFPILDPVRNVATTFHAPVRDANTPTTHDDPVAAPSPYWGDEAHLGQQGERAQSDARSQGPRLVHGAHSRGRRIPAFCKQGSNHPSAKLFPTERAGAAPRRLRAEDEEVHVRRHLLQHASSAVRRGCESHAVDQRRRPGRRLARHEEVR